MDNHNTKVVFSLGSNCGDRRRNIKEGIEWLSSFLDCCISSSVYATPDAHGGARQYMNAVVAGETCESFEDLEKACKQHEICCGRTLDSRSRGDVPIDIDVVVWGDVVVRPKDYKARYFRLGYDGLPIAPPSPLSSSD